MATGSIDYRSNLKVTDRQGVVREYPVTKTVTGLTQIYNHEIPVAASATVTLWDPVNSASGVPASFDFLYIHSDVDLQLEFTCNEGHAEEELVSLPLEADTPLVLGSDDAYYEYTTDVFSGSTLDVIDKLRCKELNAAAAIVHLVIGKV